MGSCFRGGLFLLALRVATGAETCWKIPRAVFLYVCVFRVPRDLVGLLLRSGRTAGLYRVGDVAIPSAAAGDIRHDVYRQNARVVGEVHALGVTT